MNELNFIEMKLQFDPYQDEDGFAEAFIMLDPGRKEWWIQCEMIIQQLEFRCLESNGGDSPTLFIEGVPVEPNTWHLFQMIIDPKTFEINV